MLSAAFAMMYYLIALDAHTFGDLPEQAGPQARPGATAAMTALSEGRARPGRGSPSPPGLLRIWSAPLDAWLHDPVVRHIAVAHDPAVLLAEVAPHAPGAHWVRVADGASHVRHHAVHGATIPGPCPRPAVDRSIEVRYRASGARGTAAPPSPWRTETCAWETANEMSSLSFGAARRRSCLTACGGAAARQSTFGTPARGISAGCSRPSWPAPPA